MTIAPTFRDLPLVTPPPGAEDLHPPLPASPVAFLGGRPWTLERVKIDELDTWKRQHGYRLDACSWMGLLGWVRVYVPADVAGVIDEYEEEEPCPNN
jgi:hypothetical protein